MHGSVPERRDEAPAGGRASGMPGGAEPKGCHIRGVLSDARTRRGISTFLISVTDGRLMGARQSPFFP